MNTPGSSRTPAPRILLVGPESLAEELALLHEFRPAAIVTLAGSRADALKILTEQSFDAIIANDKLLDGSASTLFEELAKLTRIGATPALFLVADAPVSGQSELAKRYPQVEGMFLRPFDDHVMASTLLAGLRKRSHSSRVTGARLSVDHLEVKVRFGEKNPPKKVRVGNLGRGGMFLAMESGFPHEGDKFSFSISIESGRKVRIEGRGVVRWIRAQSLPGLPSGVGTQFTQVLGDGLRELQELIQKLKKNPSTKAH